MATFRLSEWFGSFWRPVRRSEGAPADGLREGQRPVTIDAALQLGTVWACTRLLSETIGTLPLLLYRKDKKGGRDVDAGHPLYRILHDSPNADMTAAEFWESAIASLCLWGNAYAEIKRNGAGEIVALNFLVPDKVKVERNEAGARVYTVIDKTKRRQVPEARMFHVRGFGIGGDVGLSPVGYARRTLALSIDTDDAAANAMRNGVRPAGFLVVPNKTTSEQKISLRETFIDPITGPSGSARAAILEQGMDWKEAKGLPPEDLQLLQCRAFAVEELCRWFRVPPFMIGHTEKSSSWGTGLEQQMIGFLTFSLRPYLTRIEQAVKKQLLGPAERADVYAEFVLDGLMRADSAGRAAIWNVMAQNGIRTRNEIRQKENLPPLPGGDVLTVQSNLVPLDQLGAVSAGGDQQARSAFLNWLGIGDVIADAVKSAMVGHNGGPPLEDDR